MKEKRKLALIGGGKLSGVVAKAWADGFLPDYDLVGVWSRTFASAEKTAALAGCPALETLDALLALHPEIVAEAAGVQAVRDCALPILSSGAELITLSCGAFADGNFYSEARACAEAHHTRIHIPSGAIGGFDVLQTLTLMAQAYGETAEVLFRSEKYPAAVQKSPLYSDELLREQREVFCGNAKEAIALLPGQINVGVATSLATVGPENTEIRITTTPDYPGDDFNITLKIGEYRTALNIFSGHHDIAGWSIVALLRNLASPISFH